MTDNGAKALAERLPHSEAVVARRLFVSERARRETQADAILANGAVFLTAEEAERSRRIEAAARALDLRPDRAVTDGNAIDALRAALEADSR